MAGLRVDEQPHGQGGWSSYPQKAKTQTLLLLLLLLLFGLLGVAGPPSMPLGVVQPSPKLKPFFIYFFLLVFWEWLDHPLGHEGGYP
jgi:hypothetical protein